MTKNNSSNNNSNNNSNSLDKNSEFKLKPEQLCWKLLESEIEIKTTKDVKPKLEVFGHQTAKQALEFAINCKSSKQNAYIRGDAGTGRKTLVKYLFEQIKPKARIQKDYCFVHNFTHTNSPRLIVLEAGYGNLLKQMLASFASYVESGLPQDLNNEQNKSARISIESKTNKEINKIYELFESKLKIDNLALINLSENQQAQLSIVPIYEDKIISFEELEKIDFPDESEYLNNLDKNLPIFQEQLYEITNQVNILVNSNLEEVRKINEKYTKNKLSNRLDNISKKFENKKLNEYLDEIIEDFIKNKLHSDMKDFDPINLYSINILNNKYTNGKAPIIFENNPTLSNLIGATDTKIKSFPHTRINSGSLLKSSGGFLVIEVDEALSQSGAWSTIMRTIRSGKLDLSFENQQENGTTLIKPDLIPVDIKIILIGSYRRFYELKSFDADFGNQFKILADLDDNLERNNETYIQYIQFISNIVEKEDLLHLDKSAIVKLIEFGARISNDKSKISSHFGRLADILIEADYIANKEASKIITKKHIKETLVARRQRAFSPVKRFYNMLKDKIIIVETKGSAIGQINGLAVSSTNNIDYGFPARITATVAPGEAEIINIEGKASLSGQIHTKGFQILSGLLRHLIKPKHPLTFIASIAFEQSYGGIDGDSASGAEICCLLSALSNTKIKQSIAMTGAIDQFGNLQAIGGANEKIEGFFDCCKMNRLNGEQGVIIPKANINDLMLKKSVVDACEKGEFSIYAVENILDAFAIITGTVSSKKELLEMKDYKKYSPLEKVCEQVSIFYNQSKL